MKLLKKLKNNNKASFSYIEKGIMYMILFCVGTFIIDMILLGITMATLNHQVNYLGTKLGFQGGFIGNNSDVRHWSNESIYNYLKGGMVKVGINGVEHQWGLNYKEDINNSNWVSIIDMSKNPTYSKTFTSNNSKNSKGIAANFHQSSTVQLWFDYEYKFSGKLFNFVNVFTRMHLDTDYNSEYIN